jgi:hypothetical protein
MTHVLRIVCSSSQYSFANKLGLRLLQINSGIQIIFVVAINPTMQIRM